MITALLTGLGIALIAFAVTWAICLRIRNYSFLDVAWSYGVLVLAYSAQIVSQWRYRARVGSGFPFRPYSLSLSFGCKSTRSKWRSMPIGVESGLI